MAVVQITPTSVPKPQASSNNNYSYQGREYQAELDAEGRVVRLYEAPVEYVRVKYKKNDEREILTYTPSEIFVDPVTGLPTREVYRDTYTAAKRENKTVKDVYEKKVIEYKDRYKQIERYDDIDGNVKKIEKSREDYGGNEFYNRDYIKNPVSKTMPQQKAVIVRDTKTGRVTYASPSVVRSIGKDPTGKILDDELSERYTAFASGKIDANEFSQRQQSRVTQAREQDAFLQNLQGKLDRGEKLQNRDIIPSGGVILSRENLDVLRNNASVQAEIKVNKKLEDASMELSGLSPVGLNEKGETIYLDSRGRTGTLKSEQVGTNIDRLSFVEGPKPRGQEVQKFKLPPVAGYEIARKAITDYGKFLDQRMMQRERVLDLGKKGNVTISEYVPLSMRLDVTLAAELRSLPGRYGPVQKRVVQEDIIVGKVQEIGIGAIDLTAKGLTAVSRKTSLLPQFTESTIRVSSEFGKQAIRDPVLTAGSIIGPRKFGRAAYAVLDWADVTQSVVIEGARGFVQGGFKGALEGAAGGYVGERVSDKIATPLGYTPPKAPDFVTNIPTNSRDTLVLSDMGIMDQSRQYNILRQYRPSYVRGKEVRNLNTGAIAVVPFKIMKPSRKTTDEGVFFETTEPPKTSVNYGKPKFFLRTERKLIRIKESDMRPSVVQSNLFRGSKKGQMSLMPPDFGSSSQGQLNNWQGSMNNEMESILSPPTLAPTPARALQKSRESRLVYRTKQGAKPKYTTFGDYADKSLARNLNVARDLSVSRSGSTSRSRGQSLSQTMSQSLTQSLTQSMTRTMSQSLTQTQTQTLTESPTLTQTLTRTATRTRSQTRTPTLTPTFMRKETKRRRKKKERGVDLFVRVNKKLKAITQDPISLSRAIREGKRITGQTTAATFIIRPTSVFVDAEPARRVSLEDYYTRPTKIGKAFIQRRSRRLSTTSEIRDITMARDRVRGRR